MLREINKYLEECLEAVKNELGILEEALEKNKTFENENIRAHRGIRVLDIADLKNAGKRGKKVDTFALYDLDFVKDPEILKALNQFYKSVPVIGNYDKLLRLASNLVKSFKNKSVEGRLPGIQLQQKRGVDVSGPGFVKIKIDTPYLYGYAENDGFSVRDVKNPANGSAITYPLRAKKTAVKKFYKWVQMHRNDLGNMSFGALTKALKKAKINHRHFYANY